MKHPVKRSSSLSAGQWQTVIDQQQASDMSQRAFCNSQGIGLSTFTHWKRKLENKPATAPEKLPEQEKWIELSSDLDTTDDKTPQTWHLELELPGGVTLRMRQ